MSEILLSEKNIEHHQLMLTPPIIARNIDDAVEQLRKNLIEIQKQVPNEISEFTVFTGYGWLCGLDAGKRL